MKLGTPLKLSNLVIFQKFSYFFGLCRESGFPKNHFRSITFSIEVILEEIRIWRYRQSSVDWPILDMKTATGRNYVFINC